MENQTPDAVMYLPLYFMPCFRALPFGLIIVNLLCVIAFKQAKVSWKLVRECKETSCVYQRNSILLIQSTNVVVLLKIESINVKT